MLPENTQIAIVVQCQRHVILASRLTAVLLRCFCVAPHNVEYHVAADASTTVYLAAITKCLMSHHKSPFNANKTVMLLGLPTSTIFLSLL